LANRVCDWRKLFCPGASWFLEEFKDNASIRVPSIDESAEGQEECQNPKTGTIRIKTVWVHFVAEVTDWDNRALAPPDISPGIAPIVLHRFGLVVPIQLDSAISALSSPLNHPEDNGDDWEKDCREFD
jgi:hypothetical protein